MAKIKNDNIGTPGTPTNAAAANAKFTDITTATTTSLSNLNVKAQGVDLPNISSTGLIQDFRSYHNGATVRPWALVNDGTSAIAIAGGGSTAEIDYGVGGITLAAGDVLRIQFSVALESHSDGAAGAIYPDNEADCMMVAFVMWDIDDSGNFVPLPARASLGTPGAVASQIIIDNHDGARPNYMTDGCAVFSYNCCPVAGGVGYPSQVSQGMLVYQRPLPGASQTVYAIRLFLRGRMDYRQSGAGGHRVFSVGAGGNITHNIDYVHLMSMHMRHGTVN